MIKFINRPKKRVISTNHLKMDGAISNFISSVSRDVYYFSMCGNGKEYSGSYYKSGLRPHDESKVLLYSVEVHKRKKHGHRDYIFHYHIIDEKILRYFCKSVEQKKRFYKIKLKD